MKAPRQSEDELILGLVSISDRASQGVYQDEGLPSLEAWCRRAMTNPIRVHQRLIPDEPYDIERTLRELVDDLGCDLVFTTGGTGPSRRDVTPEVTLKVGTREMPGFGEQMRAISGHFVPTAILSRQVAVLREIPDHAALIVNLPGRPKAIAETLEGLKDKDGKTIVNGLFAAIPYCIDLIGGPYIETDETVIKAFRPKSAQRPKTPKAEPLPPAFSPEDLNMVMPRGYSEADLTVIWLHGLGADNQDFAPFADEIVRRGGPVCRFVMPNAPKRAISAYDGVPLRAWYDIRGMKLELEEDEFGMLETVGRVNRLIDELVAQGTPRERIVLGGFSQGAAMTLLCGLTQTKPLAGLVALSGYVPLPERLFQSVTPVASSLPIFMGHGTLDDIVSPLLSQSGARALAKSLPNLEYQTYDMAHEVCADEVLDMTKFLRKLSR